MIADGRAAAAGLTAGDTLLSVNGVLCTSHTQAVGLVDTSANDFDAKAIKVRVHQSHPSSTLCQ